MRGQVDRGSRFRRGIGSRDAQRREPGSREVDFGADAELRDVDPAAVFLFHQLDALFEHFDAAQ
jgi:hypothetical protein